MVGLIKDHGGGVSIYTVFNLLLITMASMKMQDAQSNPKLKEVNSLIAKAKKAGILSEQDLTVSLFEAAPSTFLEAMTSQTLAAITENCASTVDRHNSSTASVTVSSGQGEDHSYLIIAMGDRPFIVNTVVLSVRECGSDIQTLLHPLLSLKNGRRLSVLYARIDQLDDNTLNLLVDRVERSLTDLSIITEDHPSMLSQVETSARLLKERVPSSGNTEQERFEAAEFLRWLSDGGFVFLGFAEWQVEEENSGGKGVRFLDETPKVELGFFRSTNTWAQDFINECRKDVLENLSGTSLVTVTKLLTRSIVHRAERMNHVVLPQYAGDGTVRSLISIVGLFTSKTLSQEASTIPIIREKVKALIAAEKAIPNTFSYKNIIKIIDSMPKELLLRADASTLNSCLAMITGIQREYQSSALVHQDTSGKGASVIVAMPRKRFSEQVRARVQRHVEYSCGANPGSGDLHVALNVKPLVIVYYHVPLTPGSKKKLVPQTLQSELIELTKTWGDGLRDRLLNSDITSAPEAMWFKYQNSFSEEYQASTTPEACVRDIAIIETLSKDRPLRLDISAGTGLSDGLFQLSIFQWHQELAVSHLLPALENAGLHILREQAFEVGTPNSGTTYLHRLIAETKDKSVGKIEVFKKNLCAGLEQILPDHADNDILNSMLVSTELDIRALSVLRAYCAYLFQLSPFTSKGTIRNTLAAVPSAATLLWNMFEVKFNPTLGLSIEKRIEKLEALEKHYLLTLRNVPDISQDRILRNLANVLNATVRTNAYTGRETLAFKIDPSKVDLINTPKPYFEIYVRGPQTEGIHIRFGSVARGGLRWSDRRDDFRNEVLGLAKTQKVKNVVIVPTGSKGGFIVRKPLSEHDKLLKQVEECYRDYIRSLLSVTDNRVKGQITRPTDVICYDKEDPYLVVAADKGTATFSDIANKIATDEFKFWLGDAFASGGSQGYDHKLYAITANGGWECVKRHFRDLGINFEKEPFTVVGIGDMSGDVFGNGLVYSDKIKLLAAFNHKHIFIDPNPDPTKSFAERKRLFTTPRTQWSDYNKDLISSGGGIFGRFDKEISLTPEMRTALSIPNEIPNVVNGEQLISFILKAKVDLLWNGGIGTYVKSSSETNADVNDGTNDGVRVDAKELRARVIGEGGNLGFTQKARIEFERCGGKLNTDAIDNSGGVDLSDHEVNYKIFFSRLLEEGKITIEERNKILKEVSSFACTDVLKNNASHALLLTLGSRRTLKRMIQVRDLLRDLSHTGHINRTVDSLPDDEGLGKLQSAGQGLTRPELSRIYAGLKMYLKEIVVSSGITNDPALSPYLLNYFPTPIRERWQKEALEHPLRPQIIATKLVNEMVDLMGATFVHRTCRSLKVDPVDVVKAYVVAASLIDLPAIKAEIKNLDTYEGAQNFLEFSEDLNVLMAGLLTGIVGNMSKDTTVGALTSYITPLFKEICSSIEPILSPKTFALVKERTQRALQAGLSTSCAQTLALRDCISNLYEILALRSGSTASISELALTYSTVINRLGLEDILLQIEQLSMQNRWEQELLVASRSKIQRSVRDIVSRASKSQSKLNSLWEGHAAFARIRDITADINQRGMNLAALSLLADDLPLLAS